MKPWGIAPALMCAALEIDAPFAVINADGFYGCDAFERLHEFLSAAQERSMDSAPVVEQHVLGNFFSRLPARGEVRRIHAFHF